MESSKFKNPGERIVSNTEKNSFRKDEYNQISEMIIMYALIVIIIIYHNEGTKDSSAE